ncbi:ABC transporter permease subunit [Malacoplasma penetrans]|uniref:PhnE/PtxC family ABC transporter permease n=1 Tax=Malacoplasma penetrans TaxID=28227 RepID=UPI0010123C25|nr:ABC transporter permease subunit [Malacoplasma penetrans]RXY96060.1 ABC transporter permease subunit [Malacoplasma penetrans]
MKNNLVKSNFFFSYIDNENKYKKKKISLQTKILISIAILVLVVVSFIAVGFNVSPRGLLVFSNRISEIFSFSNSISDYPNYSLVQLSLNFLWITIKGVLIGTTFGFILAFITSTFSNSHLFKNTILERTIRVITAFLRAFPTIIFVYLFSTIFSKNLSLVLVLFWFSWLWLHKYMSEFYQNLNYYPYYNLLIQRYSKTKSFLKTIIPQINNKFISLFLYSFDSNMRWSSILGTLGLAGIGELIEKASHGQYSSMGIPVLTIMLFMLFLETIIFLFNRFLFVHKSVVFNKTMKDFTSYKNIKTYIKLFLLISLVSLILVSLITLNWTHTSNDGINFIKSWFNPNWNILSDTTNFNITLDILNLFAQVIVIMSIVFILSLLLILISCFKLFGYYSLIGIFISTIIRSLPMIAIFFIFNPIFIDPTSTICLILAVSTSTVICKNITESINKLKSDIISSYLIQGYSKIYVFFRYILPSIKNDYVTLFLFEQESQFRELITYGAFGASAIGFNISVYFAGTRKQWNNMFAFVWVSFFIIVFMIAVHYLIKIFVLENKNIFKLVSDAKLKLLIQFKIIKNQFEKI